MRATLLVLLLSTFTLIPDNAQAGGEDFPFFCWINGDQGESFKIVSDNRSETGYKMHYYKRGKLLAIMPTVLENTTANRHTWVRAKYQNGLFDRHLVAFIGKTAVDYSSADTAVSLHGLDPLNYKFRSLKCQ